MKNLFIPSILIFSMIACTQQVETSGEEASEKEKQNIELAKSFLMAMENEDIEQFEAVLAENAVFEGPSFEQIDTIDEQDIEDQASWFEGIDSLQYNVFYELHHVVEDEGEEDNWVLIWCNPSWYNIEYGKKIQIMAHFDIRCVDGKIDYVSSYWNQWDLYKQIGAKLEWPGDTD